MKKYLLTALLCSFTVIGFAQVGVNTTEPEESLHVAGTLRVENTGTVTTTKILGRDDKGTVGTINVGEHISITNNTLISSGSSDYGIVNYPVSASTPGTQFHNIDLDLDADNLYKVGLINQTCARKTGEALNA